MTSSHLTDIRVDLGDRAYPIYIGRECLDTLTEMLAAYPAQAAIGLVTDAHVAALHGDRVAKIIQDSGRRCVTHVLAPGEEHKRLTAVEAICGAFLEGSLDRSSVVVALGGGVVGDVAGFAAAAFMRGIPFIQIPTTIVAQVDSSVGGKTGVNHPLGKNTIGAFHQPDGVLIDMRFLDTLPDRELRAGLAEVIKHGVIADEALFAHMETAAEAILQKDLNALVLPVKRSCEIKAAIVAADEKEMGLRANLNYGHTFGHAFEAVTGYTHFLHGEAIALGMCAAAALANALEMVDHAFVLRQNACIAQYGLPTAWPELPVAACMDAMRKDKKVRSGVMKFILADAMGKVSQRTDVPESAVVQALEAVRKPAE